MDNQLSSPLKLAIITSAILWLIIFMACFLLNQQLNSVTTQLNNLQAELTKLSHSPQTALNTVSSDIIAKIQQENQEIKKLLVDNLQPRSQTDLQLMQQIANTNKLMAQLLETMQSNVKSNERLLKQNERLLKQLDSKQ